VYKINIINIIYFLPQDPHPGLTLWMRAIIDEFNELDGAALVTGAEAKLALKF
jgi:hypothetical protein